MTDLERQTHYLTAGDGTKIAYHLAGQPAPPVILANGLGGPFEAWREQIDYLGKRFRIVGWDYRGMYESQIPPGATASLSMPTQAEDLKTILDAQRIERAAFIGWSMGAQVLLELYSKHPQRVESLVLINATYGNLTDNVGLPLARRLAPLLLGDSQRFEKTRSRLFRRALGWPETGLWLRRLGIIGKTIHADRFNELARELSQLDPKIFRQTLSELAAHDPRDVLSQIEVPTLVIAAERDAFTPRAQAEEMARQIPQAELLMVRGGTHYAPLEYPELINLRIEKFLKENTSL